MERVKEKKERDCPCYHSKEPCNYACPCHNPYMSGACFECEGLCDLEDVYLAMKYRDARMRAETSVTP